jgi:hypothetical protein
VRGRGGLTARRGCARNWTGGVNQDQNECDYVRSCVGDSHILGKSTGPIQYSPCGFDNRRRWIVDPEGHARAQINYGLCLQHGRGCEASLEQAAEFYCQSADQNHPDGSCHSALLSHCGITVDVDLDEAARDYDQTDGRASLNSFRCPPALGCDLPGLDSFGGPQQTMRSVAAGQAAAAYPRHRVAANIRRTPPRIRRKRDGEARIQSGYRTESLTERGGQTHPPRVLRRGAVSQRSDRDMEAEPSMHCVDSRA